jgi:heterodisulfide reductase subunit B
MNVIYISRNASKLEGTTEIEIPSLKEKHQNIVNGNCDLSIQCKKVGKNYIRVAKARRKDYMRDQVDDPEILKILDSITGVFGRSPKTTKKVQDEIVKKIEEKEDVLQATEEKPSDAPVPKTDVVEKSKSATRKTAPVNQTTSTPQTASNVSKAGRIKPKI